MKGTASEKYFALEHKYPSKIEIIERFGYDPKQLHHLVRMKYFIKNYIEGKRYAECLVNDDDILNQLLCIKTGVFGHGDAIKLAEETYKEICDIYNGYKEANPEAKIDKTVLDLLDKIQYKIMETAVITEFSDKLLLSKNKT